MEFLKALKLAKEQGVSVQEFVPIWQAELQLKQQKEEIKLQELKLKQTKGVEPLVHEQMMKQKEEITQLKSEVLAYNQAILQVVQEISSMLGLQSPTNLNLGPKFYQDQDSLLYQQAAREGSYDNSQTKADKFTNATATPGIDFEVTNVRELVANREERITPVYTLPLCAYSFKLSISFNSEGHLIMFLIVTPSEYADNSLTNPISVCGKAYILNKGSHSYSKIWDLSMETDAACKSITAEKEVKIEAKVSLKTCKSKLDVVKLEDLEVRNFLFDNSIFIKWMVEPFDILSGNLGSDDKTGAGNPGAKKATNAKGKSEKNQKTNAKKPLKRNLTYSFLSEKKDVHIGESATAETPGDNALVVDVVPFPESGDVFTVTKISELLSSNTPQQTQTFSLPSCPCVFRLCVSFTDKKLMKVEMVVVRVRQNVSMKWPLYVSSHGYITNGDGANSMLWEIPFEKKLTKFRIGDEKKLTMPICLKSPSGDLKEISLEELEARSFVRDDALTISWLVSAMGTKEFLEQKNKNSSSDVEMISPDVKNENITSSQDARWVIS